MAGAVLFFCLMVVAAPGQRLADHMQGRRMAPYRFAQVQARQTRQQNVRQYRNQQRPQNQPRLNQNQPRPYQPQQRPYQNQPRPTQSQTYQNQPRAYQQTPQYNGTRRQVQPAVPGYGGRPYAPAPAYNRPNPYANRPGDDRNVYPGAAPPGHLGDWLNRNRGLPIQDQERLLRNDPNFNRLPPAQQQRLVQQLHNLDEMPEARRQRYLARSEMLEHMPPQQQMQVRQAGRNFLALPPDRQAVVKRAFQDLRSVPLDQRATVLNSARYQNQFSPQERDMLNNLLRAEPYEPPR
jgi:hypothetical protein